MLKFKIMLKTKLISVLLIISCYTFSQSYDVLNYENKHIVSMGVSANPEMNVSVDYMFHKTETNHLDFAYTAGINIPTSTSYKFDFDVHAGIASKIYTKNRWGIIGGINWENSFTADLNGDYFTTGLSCDILPGYFGKNWTITPHLGIRYMPFIHIKQSSYPLEAFDDLDSQVNYEKHDGWFTQTNLISKMGLNIGRNFQFGTIQLMFGYQHIYNKLSLIALSDIGIMPFYGSVNVAIPLKNKN